MHHIKITIGNQQFTASLYDNDTVRALIKDFPLTLTMEELHGNEKYYYLPGELPTEMQSVSQIHTGDLKLFSNDCFVLFYKDFTTSYAYTSLGKVDKPQGLAYALGNGKVIVRFDVIG